MFEAALALGQRLPWRWLIAGASAIAIVAAGVSWHRRQIAAVKIEAMQEQAALSAEDFRLAYEAAQEQQAREIAAARVDQAGVNKEKIDDLAAENDRIGRRYAGLRQLWADAQSAAHSSGTGAGGAAALPEHAGAAAGDTAVAAGRVDLETAATLAEAADRNEAGWRAVIDWWLQQCKAWRGPKPDECAVE
jgi:predicted metal-dependent phosphoesterase TrpH